MRLARIRLEFDLRHAWVGVSWDDRAVLNQFVIAETRTVSGMVIQRIVHPRHLHVYLCLIPFVALHVELALGLPREEPEP
jgi:hypothetical protein